MAADGSADRLEEVRSLLGHHTQRLLGDTITLSDESWREPSRLPGWSRAHVATHLARQADALRRLTAGVLSEEPGTMYDSDARRSAEIEAGAGRTGLELQIDLDTTAGALATDFEDIAEQDRWGTPVELRGGQQVPVRLLPLARLGELVLHHVDLDIGPGIDDVGAETAEWLLEYLGFRLGDDVPRLVLEIDGEGTTGGTVEVGGRGEPTTVSGPAHRLLGWLTRRSGTEGLTGADGVELPAFG